MAESQYTISESNACVIDHIQLRAYLIRNGAPHVISNYVHLTVAILSGKKNKIVRQCYVLLTARHDSYVHMNRKLLDEAVLQFLWMYAFMGKRGKVPQIIPTKHSLI